MIDAKDLTLIKPATAGPFYPHGGVDSHQWSELAYFAIEMGGYGDLTMIDPSNGKRLHLMRAWDGPDGPRTLSSWDALRKLIDAAEQVHFGQTDGYDEEHVGQVVVAVVRTDADVTAILNAAASTLEERA